MTAPRLSRWLLVNYAGYPYAPNSLMPDNGLANLAGGLIAEGCAVTILDYATPTTLAAFTDAAATRRLRKVWSRMADPRPGPRGALDKVWALRHLRAADRDRIAKENALLERLLDDIVARVERQRIDAVGFKLWNGDGLTGSARLAEGLRRRCPRVFVVGGGPQVDTFMALILERYAGFHALVYGEGEDTIRQLAARGGDTGRADRIPNLIYRVGSSCALSPPAMIDDLDALPPPVYRPDVYPAMAGDEKIRIAVLDESRGCRNGCAFCIHPVKSHRSVRLKGVPRLLEDIDALRRAHGMNLFRFAGSCTPYALLNDIAQALSATEHPCMYTSFAHVRESDRADFRALRASGCVALFFGVESGSPRILKQMHKGIAPDAIAATLRAAQAAGIYTVASLIVPAPGDDAASEDETFELMRRATPDAVIVQPGVVIPRTPWFEQPTDYNIALRDPAAYLDRALAWKAKLLLPPTFWDDLPIRIDGQPFKTRLKRALAFSQRLERAGFVTAVSDEAYLMALRLKLTPLAFRDLAREAFFTADADAVRDLVVGINRQPEQEA